MWPQDEWWKLRELKICHFLRNETRTPDLSGNRKYIADLNNRLVGPIFRSQTCVWWSVITMVISEQRTLSLLFRLWSVNLASELQTKCLLFKWYLTFWQVFLCIGILHTVMSPKSSLLSHDVIYERPSVKLQKSAEFVKSKIWRSTGFS